jgi:hypothetical protein
MKFDEVGTTLKHPETINGNVKNLSIHMKSDEVGTNPKHPETINGNIKNLSKRIEKVR